MLEEKNKELLRAIPHPAFPDLMARRPGKPDLRRYTGEEETRALALYFQGPRSYRFLQKRYVLPHPRTLRRKMEKIQMRPGFHDAILALIKEKFTGSSDQDKLCVIAFDEIHLKPRLAYQRSEDIIEGFADHGPLGRSNACADHALVMMVRGITKRWKQPVGFFLSAGTTKATVQQQLLVQCIRRVTEAGLTVLATTCDMGTNNQTTYRLLGAADSGVFTVDGRNIIALYDVPHLFKCLRNALMKHDIEVDGELSSWRYLETLFEVDSASFPRAAPKLTERHIRPNNFEKMKVRYAVQVMSRTVSAAITMYATFNKLPRSSLPTATFLLRLNNLLDVLNSSTRFNTCSTRRAISNIHPVTAEEHIKILVDGEAWLQRWTVGDGASIDSVRGLIQTIKGVQEVWKLCQAAGCTFLCTRRLNQDALENFFGIVRQRGGGTDSPDPIHFRHLYKHASLNDLLLVPATSNCADDGDRLLAVLRQVTMETKEQPGTVPPPPSLNTPSGAAGNCPVEMETRNVLTYVCGYLLRTARIRCDRCKAVVIKQEAMPLVDSEIFTALKSYTSISTTDVGSLLRPTEDCDAFIIACHQQFRAQAEHFFQEAQICKRLVSCALETKEARQLAQEMCHPAVLGIMAATYMRMELHRMCKNLVKRKTTKTIPRPKAAATKKLAKLQHR